MLSGFLVVKWEGARFVIFQINTDFLINQLKNIFTQDTLRSSVVSQKKRSQ